jgi:hypothetical protein
LFPLIELLIIAARSRIAYHAQRECLILAALIPLDHTFIKHPHRVILIIISEHILKQLLPGCQSRLLRLPPWFLNHIQGHLLHFMIQETALLPLVGLLNEVFEDLVLELRHQGLVNLEVNESVAEVSLEAIGHLNEVSGFRELLLLDFEDSLQEVIVSSVFR